MNIDTCFSFRSVKLTSRLVREFTDYCALEDRWGYIMHLTLPNFYFYQSDFFYLIYQKLPRVIRGLTRSNIVILSQISECLRPRGNRFTNSNMTSIAVKLKKIPLA